VLNIWLNIQGTAIGKTRETETLQMMLTRLIIGHLCNNFAESRADTKAESTYPEFLVCLSGEPVRKTLLHHFNFTPAVFSVEFMICVIFKG
jgi:hypothetical protein